MPVQSNLAFWQKNAPKVKRTLKFRNVKANFQFTLPGNAMLIGDVFVFNNGAGNQAAVTVGTAAAGSQFSAGTAVNSLNTAVTQVTRVQPLRTDRQVFVESAAWQDGVHLVVEYLELPPVPVRAIS